MSNFIDKAEDILRARSGISKKEEEAFRIALDVIKDLALAQSKSQLDLDNVESVYGAIEMACILDHWEISYRPEEARTALQTLISTTIRETTRISRRKGRVQATREVREFLTQIQSGTNGRIFERCSFITFNYDIVLETGLATQGIEYDYGLGDRDRSLGVKTYKLHGSVNWRAASRMDLPPGTPPEEIIVDYDLPVHADSIFFAEEDEGPYTPFDPEVPKMFRRDGPDGKSNAYEAKGPAFLVPPTWSKANHHSRIRQVWEGAARALRDADNIVIVGYSLPPSDEFFRYLFALGTLGRNRLRNVWVVNPDKSGETEARFRSLLGQATQGRMKYLPDNFGQIKGLESIL